MKPWYQRTLAIQVMVFLAVCAPFAMWAVGYIQGYIQGVHDCEQIWKKALDESVSRRSLYL